MKPLKNNKLKVYIFLFSISILIIYPGCYKKSDYSTNSANNEPPALNEIFMQNMAFTPADMSITVGTTIKWTNKDGTAHTVTNGTPGSPLGLFDSGNIAPNGDFTFTFNKAGTYKYFCRIHPMMIGTITVTSHN
jgi:plastocyanin